MNKVCIIYDFFAPAYKAGGPIQSLVNLVSHLGSSLDLFVICGPTDHDGTQLPVKTNEWVPYQGNSGTATGRAKVWYAQPALDSRSVQQLTTADMVLYINGIFSVRYNLFPLLFSKSPRKILAVRGMLHPGALSQKPLKKNLYLALLKALGVHRKVEFHATAAEEADFIRDRFGKNSKVTIIPNFPKVLPHQMPPEKSGGSLILVSVALVSAMKNHLQVLKALHNTSAQITYHIFGPIKDAAYWKLCGEQIEALPDNVTVHYHGDIVPSDVAQALEAAHVFILPSKSENFGHAIFEAFTAGKPVITSFNTPWNGLKEKKAGINVNPDREQDLTGAIQFFADMNANELDDWSRQASSYAMEAVNVEALSREYLNMFSPRKYSILLNG